MHSPFYEFAPKMNLSAISKDKLYNFIERKFKKSDLPISNQTIDKILEKSECQPHFTQYFASVVFDLIKAGIDQNEESFPVLWMKNIIIPQTDVFQDIYDQLTNSQRATLQAIARLTDHGIYSKESRNLYGLPLSSSLNEALKELQKRGLIYKTEDSLKITNPIFKEWLISLN
jgi:uncharacterized protein